MTKQTKTRAVDAGKFVDEVLADIQAASDQEMLEDDSELEKITGETADDFAARVMHASTMALGKTRFADAAEGLRKSMRPPQVVPTSSSATDTKRAYVHSVEEAAAKFSLAARGATQISKRDLDSAVEDLSELKGRQSRRPKK